MAKVKKDEEATQEPNQTNPPQTGSFGITTETKTKSSIGFLPPIVKENGTHDFTLGYITNVAYETPLDKNKNMMHYIAFYLRDKSEKRTHMERVFFPKEPDKVYKTKETAIDVFYKKLGHIYAEFAPIPKEGLGTGAATKEEFLQAIADAFNKNGRSQDGKEQPIYHHILVWFKLVYNADGFLQFPFGPNFIEKHIAGKTPLLTVTGNDVIIAPKRKTKDKADLLGGEISDTDDVMPEWA
jgi:Holliday junction resolvasome RuvABC endonuclease subunit